MARIQDIRTLEERIFNTIEDYLRFPDGYDHPAVKIARNQDTKEYEASLVDTEEPVDDVFPMGDLILKSDDGAEPDGDKVSDIANSYLFIE